MENDIYCTINATCEGLVKEKGSKFLAFAIPVNNPLLVKDILATFKKNADYKGACHFCYAYKIGINGEFQKSNDDGEPSGTAGKPILGQIESSGITNILVVVVRFFGGVLLGTGGLTKAYKSAAADALAVCIKIENIKVVPYEIKFNYEFQNEAEQLLKQFKLEPIEKIFDENITFKVAIKKSQHLDFYAQATQFYHITIQALN
jgi:uncharacterized YigZ family protein